MQVTKITPTFKDERGIIQDIMVSEPIDHVTVITSVRGSSRGHHYHKETIQWVYLFSGKLQSLTQQEGEPVISTILEPGDLIRTDLMERHALNALEDSVFFVFTKGPRGGNNYENDTYRIDDSLAEV
jgi:hypothetical protein